MVQTLGAVVDMHHSQGRNLILVLLERKTGYMTLCLKSAVWKAVSQDNILIGRSKGNPNRIDTITKQTVK